MSKNGLKFQGIPKDHGIDSPVRGDFGVMQELVKKFHEESNMNNLKYAKKLIKVAKTILSAKEGEIRTTLAVDWKSKKTGQEFKKGTPVTLRMMGKDGGLFTRVDFTDDFNNRLFSTMHLYKYFRGLRKPPSDRQMEKWMDDGYALTVTGKRTEPDGYGYDGSPSWLLIMGFI